jgi:hypothetical protein
MSHAIYRVESFCIVGPYTLRVKFDDDRFWRETCMVHCAIENLSIRPA